MVPCAAGEPAGLLFGPPQVNFLLRKKKVKLTTELCLVISAAVRSLLVGAGGSLFALDYPSEPKGR